MTCIVLMKIGECSGTPS